MSESSPLAVSLPAPPQQPAGYSFPVLASVAPVLGSLVMWAVTRSPYLLAFAVLGPIVALGSVLDARWKAARLTRAEQRRFTADARATLEAIRAAHARERAALDQSFPAVSRILASGEHDPERWRADFAGTLPVTLGRGPRESALSVNGDAPARDTAAGDTLRQLRIASAQLQDAPITVDARLGIGVCGPRTLAVAVARALAVQLANALSPADTEVSYGPDQGWMSDLPHRTRGGPPDSPVVFTRVGGAAQGRAVIAASTSAATLPRECRVVVGVGGPAAVLRHPVPDKRTAFRPEPVSEEQVRGYAAILRAAAGGMLAATALPDRVSLADFRPAPGSPPSLRCTVARGTAGEYALDLVGDGPHAIIGGTTGSGKSELLVTWVLAMAEAYGPQVVNFLLVDFKGGSSFSSLAQLPHCVGLITDLDEAAAGRALTSLRAELRYRERALAEAKVRSIEDLPAHTLPRLVIVVDEFAAMVTGFPELHSVFSDVASRGRSLGVHLILCTQRPAGVVRDAVSANCTLRISLRVNNQADSIAVIGSPAAAQLPRLPLGRAFIALAGAEPDLVHIALAGTADVERIDGRWPRIELRRPWCDPLPRRITMAELPVPEESGVAFALADLPEEQRQACAVYAPERQGNLLIVGSHGSGKSMALAAIAAGAPGAAHLVPGGVAGAWDCLTAVLEELRSGGAHPRLLLLDDIDALLGRLPQDYQGAFLDMLCAVLREGPGSGVCLVVTVQRTSAALQPVASLCDTRMLLRLPDRQEHVMAGGIAAEFVPNATPGAAVWRGHRVQVAVAPDLSIPDEPPVPVLDLTGVSALAVVSGRPLETAEKLRRRSDVERVVPLTEADGIGEGTVAGRAMVVVGDAESWQSHWAMAERARATMPLLFERCSVRDYRAISREHALPPPLPPGALWLLRPDGGVTRVRLDAPATRGSSRAG